MCKINALAVQKHYHYILWCYFKYVHSSAQITDHKRNISRSGIIVYLPILIKKAVLGLFLTAKLYMLIYLSLIKPRQQTNVDFGLVCDSINIAKSTC